jgi:hypothetical protein
MSGPKPFSISEHMVFEAYRRVKADKGRRASTASRSNSSRLA